MSFSFPTSPSVNELYTFGNKTWRYNGTGWALVTNIDVAQTAWDEANLAYVQAETATVLAQGAFDNSNTKFSTTGGSITGNVSISGNLSVTGNISYTGNVTSVSITGNSGQFFGNTTTGFNALYAGIPTGYLIDPQTVFQLSSNYDGYTAISFENQNHGQFASADLFLTPDNGSANDTFLDVGIGSSTYNYPGYGVIRPNDAYVIAYGNTNTNGGNLILNSALNDIMFVAGGTDHDSVIMRVQATNNVVIIPQNPSTSTDTGVLVVGGGVGVAGNVYAGAVYSDSFNYINGVSITDNANAAFLQANTPSYVANSAALYANGAFVQANAAYQSQNTTGSYANSAYAQANGASLYANGAFIQANAAFLQANTPSYTANSASLYANGAFVQANASYGQANSASLYANGAFIQANAAFLAANTPSNIANSASLYANGAFVQANSAYTRANNSVNANTGGTITGDITITGNLIVSGANVALGNVGNVHIYGGNTGQVLVTDNQGNLTFIDLPTTNTTTYVADTLTLTNGVYVSGSVTDTQVLNDGNYYAITDGSNTGPAWIITTTFTGVVAFNRLVTNIDYTASSGHTIYFQIYNNVTLSWDNLGSYSGASGYSQYALEILQYTPYISSGVVQIRLYHSNTGNPAHVTHLDYLALQLSAQGAQGPRGATGATGATGPGVASGGSVGQVLIKNSTTNYDTTWSNNLIDSWNTGNSAFIQANAAFLQANTPDYVANSAALYANGAFLQANAAYQSQNTTGTYANSAYTQANTATTNASTADSKAVTSGSYANSAFGVANSASIYANGAFTQANAAFISANTPSAIANSAALYANGAFVQANAAFISANTPSAIANSAALYANGAFVQANAAFISANTPSAIANSAALYANGAFIQANAAFIGANTPSAIANSAALYANGAFVQANAAFIGANTPSAIANSAALYANGAFIQANAAFIGANTPSAIANSAALYANGAFIQANASYGQANSAGIYANGAFTYANSAYTRANNSINANTGGTITGDLTITGNLIINGTTTSVNTTTITTTDSLIKLANNNTVGDSLDIGFYGVSNTFGSTAPTYHGLVRQAGSNNFLLFKSLTQDPTSNVLGAGSATAANVATLIANVAGYSITSNGVDLFLYTTNAYIQANTPSNIANSAALYANGAFIQANAAFIRANTPDGISNSAAIYANGAFIQANAAFLQANTPDYVANSAALYANGAFLKANSVVQTGFTTFAANGTNVTPASNNDTITITPGTGILLSACTTTKTITISSSGAGAAVTFAATPPASGNTAGDRWIDSSDGTQYTWVSDGNSYQWVDFTSPSINTYSIFGGSAGTVPYQQGASNTAFTLPGTNGQLLTINNLTPAWISQTALTIANTQITGVITAAQHANTAVTPGTYGGATAIPVITVDQQGRLTSAANVAVQTGLTITNDNSTVATYYPLLTPSTTGTIYTQNVSSTGLTYIPSSGTLSATVMTATSDENLKENIVTITNAVDTVKQLRGVEYDWRENKQHSMGVVAQELEKVLPYLVHDNENGKSVMYSNMIGLLIEAIKEQQIQIDELKGKINGND
jgi:hypothetical protein